MDGIWALLVAVYFQSCMVLLSACLRHPAVHLLDLPSAACGALPWLLVMQLPCSQHVLISLLITVAVLAIYGIWAGLVIVRFVSDTDIAHLAVHFAPSLVLVVAVAPSSSCLFYSAIPYLCF